MSRIPISALGNGVLFVTKPFSSPANPEGVPVLTPAAGVVCEIVLHGTTTPAAVWTDEFGTTAEPQFVATDADGVVPGWVDPTTLPLDLLIPALADFPPLVLAGGGGGSSPTVITGFDGGAPSTTNTDFLDGGSPSSTPTTVVDGGTP